MMTQHQYLTEALSLAQIRRGLCAPNPSVGAVIVNADGAIVATGYHLGPGSDHAEVDALKKLNHNIPQDATMYVTLEPCCHTGRTPPCTNAIITSGIRNVVYAYKDPNPIVSGKGAEVLRTAGINCQHISHEEINQFYESYTHWHLTKTPFITAKIAMTLDGKIAGINSEPIKITGNEINQYTHSQRKSHDAILTTINTILADDPQLNARCEDQTYSKIIYILDSHLQLPLNAKILSTAKHITVFHHQAANKIKQQRLAEAGVRCIEIYSESLLDLKKIIRIIGDDGIHSLWVESGSKCFNAFLNQQLLQRAYIYIAPWQYGEGKSAFQTDTPVNFFENNVSWRQFGNDVLCEINW